MIWPPYFPALCPPIEATEVEGPLYRLISGKVPKPSDFHSYELLYPDRDWGDKACQACGLSTHRSLQDGLENYQRLQRRIPSLRKKIAVAKANHLPGKILNTPSREDRNHYTW